MIGKLSPCGRGDGDQTDYHIKQAESNCDVFSEEETAVAMRMSRELAINFPCREDGSHKQGAVVCAGTGKQRVCARNYSK